MRNYDSMTDEEFIKAYETPYTKEEMDEMHKIAQQQIADGEVYDVDEVLAEIFGDDLMNSDVRDLINKINSDGNCFLSLKPRIDDLDTTVAHLYCAGGKMCNFNIPDGSGFKIWNKEYEKYSYGECEFIPGKGFNKLFNNWDSMVKTCYNRAHDEENFKKGKVSGKKPVNHFERMRENMIAAYNCRLNKELLAVIDMEYSVDKTKLNNEILDKNPKADLVCVAVENDKIVFYITEYKSTNNGFGVSLKQHYDDMSSYIKDEKIKEHLIKTLQERLYYGLINCKDSIANIIYNMTVENIEVNLLFLFSNTDDFFSDKKNVLDKGYKYIFEKSNKEGVVVKYAYIEDIKKGCLKKTLLKDFESGGEFNFN